VTTKRSGQTPSGGASWGGNFPKKASIENLSSIHRSASYVLVLGEISKIMDSEPDLEIELTDEAPLSSSPVEASPLSIGTDQYGDAECG